MTHNCHICRHKFSNSTKYDYVNKISLKENFILRFGKAMRMK